MIHRQLLIGMLVIAMLPLALAHAGHGVGHSVEDIIIRVDDADLSAGTYTLSCELPEGANSPRTWSLRSTKDAAAQSTLEGQFGETWTVNIPDAAVADGKDPQDLWHIACQTTVGDDFENVRGDFHIDLRSEDERTSAYPDSPNVLIDETEGQSFTATCIPKEGTSPSSVYWRVFSAHGEGDLSGEGPLTISEALPEAGLWDIECGQDGDFWPIPVEFFQSGPAYVPTIDGCVPGEHCYLDGDGSDTGGNDTSDDQTGSDDTDACFESVQHIPVSCEGGSITSDVYNGCRQVTCEGSSSSMTVLACDKDSSYEIYKQDQQGTGVSQVCFGDTCLDNGPYSGFDKGALPYCTQTNDTDDTTDETDDDTTEQTCTSDLTALPGSCTGGTITSDTFNGCRFITCEGSSSSMTVQACDKDGHFEMYKKSQEGSSVEQVCIADTCLDNGPYSGFSRSPDYPICTDAADDIDAPSDGNETDTNTSIPSTEWLEPSADRSDVNPFDLHMHVFDMEGEGWLSTDFEVYDPSQDLTVWTYHEAPENHVHFGDGQWGASKQHLLYDHEYVVKSRFRTADGVGAWNERSFITEQQEDSSEEPGNWTWTPAERYKVELVAQGLSFPTNIEDAPELYSHLPTDDQPLLYVTHLYGQIGMVTNGGDHIEYADGLLNYEVFGSLPGSGEMGVTGLYVDPSTGDVYASMVYHVGNEEFEGKVVRYHTNDDGDGFTSSEIVVDGVPSAPSHQIQDVTRGPDGALYVSVGDANMLDTVKDFSFWNGKILRIDEGTGEVSVHSAGYRNPFGIAWRPGTTEVFAGNNGPDSDDGIYRVTGPGQTFGWCCDTAQDTWRHYPQTVVPTSLDFADGDGSALYAVLAGTTNAPGPQERGKRIMRIQINSDGSAGAETQMVRYTGDGFGSPTGMAFVDGAMYFTDLLGETGEAGNIYRLVPGVQTDDPAPGPDGLTATMAAAAWYPQGRDMIWECRASSGSGDYVYDYRFGDGNGVFGTQRSDVYYTYPSDGTYDASCTVHDQQTGESVSDSATLSIGESRGTTDDPDDTTDNQTGDDGSTGGSTALSVKDWYPQGRDYVFVCGLEAPVDWSFGDGDRQFEASNEVFHRYAEAGDYTVTCGDGSESGSLDVTVA